eukprot:scaffold29686_cov75-Attheya_sp.AAC.3
MHADPCKGPVHHLIKINIAGEFYWIHLAPADMPMLGLSLPLSHDGSHLIDFPLTLSMGWVNSPPLFWATSKTICDMGTTLLTHHPAPQATHQPAPCPVLCHWLDEVMCPSKWSDPKSAHQEPASIKKKNKLKKEDAYWAIHKVALVGWLLDTVSKCCIALKKWHQIIGELRKWEVGSGKWSKLPVMREFLVAGLLL